MSDDQHEEHGSVVPGGSSTSAQKEALVKAIREEMEALSPDELQRLYALIALMDQNQDG